MTDKPPETDTAVDPASEVPEELPVGSLRELFDRDDARVEAFKVGLKAKTSTIDRGDFDHVVAIVTRNPSLLTKVADLVRVGPSLEPTFRTPIMRLGVMIVQNASDDLTGWAATDDKDAAQLFAQVTNWAKKLLQNKDKAVGAKADLIVSIALIILQTNRDLRPGVALDSIIRARGFGSDGRSDSRPEGAVSLLLRRAKPGMLASFARVRLLSTLEVAEALEKVEDAVAVRDAERARSEALQREIQGLQNDLAVERANLMTASAKIAELETKIESTRSLGAHDFGGMKAKYRRVVTDEIARGVQDAVDSLEMDNPKPSFAIDFLKQIQLIIKRESKWLDASTD